MKFLNPAVLPLTPTVGWLVLFCVLLCGTNACSKLGESVYPSPGQRPRRSVAEDVAALCKAAERGDTNVLEELLSNGVSANVLNELDRPVIFDGIRGGNEDVVNMLIRFGADVNGESEIGHPLSYAATLRRVRLVSTLLNAGATANPKTRDGVSPLMDAAIGSEPSPTEYELKASLKIVEELIRHGADANAADCRGMTALDYVEDMIPMAPHYQRMVDLLIEHGARSNTNRPH